MSLVFDMAARDGASFYMSLVFDMAARVRHFYRFALPLFRFLHGPRSCSAYRHPYRIGLVAPCIAARVRPQSTDMPYCARTSCMAARVRPTSMMQTKCRSCSTWPLVFGPPLVTVYLALPGHSCRLEANTMHPRTLQTSYPWPSVMQL
jgi:hypothetical protein